jgi:hypothetical protein
LGVYFAYRDKKVVGVFVRFRAPPAVDPKVSINVNYPHRRNQRDECGRNVAYELSPSIYREALDLRNVLYSRNLLS